MQLKCDNPRPPILNPLAETYISHRHAATMTTEHIRAIALHEQDFCFIQSKKIKD